jgi:glycerol-3-phosphate dehydrogenase
MDVAKYLVSSYGERANEILKLTLKDKSLKERLLANEPFIKAEFVYHIHQEMA